MKFPSKTAFTAITGLILLLLLSSACQREEGCLDSSATNYDVSADLDCCCEYPNLELRIFRVAGTETFSVDSVYQDAGGDGFQIADTRFYISDFHLVRDDGTEVGITDSIFIEKLDNSNEVFEDNFARINPDANLYEIGQIQTQGNFSKISFVLGLVPDVNHSNPDNYAGDHPLAIQSDSLHINQQEGYKFNVMDITTFNDTTTYFVSSDPNSVQVEIDYDLTVLKAFDVEVQIDVDLTGLLENVDFSNDDFNTIQDKIVTNTPGAFSKHE